MKTIFVDTNSINENGSLCINELIIKNLGLEVGEKVIAYQDEDSWEAQIVFLENQWGVELISDTREVSRERQEGHQEGFWEGYYVQSINLLRVLKDLNFSANDIEKIKKRLGIK